jgi:hypothetical protein
MTGPADNAAGLQTIGTGYRAGVGNPAGRRPRDVQEDRTGQATFTGDAAATAFVVAHGMGSIPSNIQITATTAVAAASKYVSSRDATNFTVTFTAAPAAGASNIKFDWRAAF